MSNFLKLLEPKLSQDLFINTNNVKMIYLENDIYDYKEKCYTLLFNDKTVKFVCNPENMRRIEKFLNTTTIFSNKKDYDKEKI